MVRSKAHISSKNGDKRGEGGVAELTTCLWPVDCQSRNRPLGADPPALLIDDMLAFATASLHHRWCQSSEWRERAHRRTSRVSSPDGPGPPCCPPCTDRDPRPMLVNPSMEMIFLQRDACGRWQVDVGSSFHAMGLRPPGSELIVDGPLPGMTGHVTSGAMAVTFQGATPSRSYAAPVVHR
ncbi:hypothetical protein AB0J43_08235 [Nonomuraea fuscirosea]